MPAVQLGSLTGHYQGPEGTRLSRIDVVGVRSYPAQGGMFLLDRLPAGRHDLVFYTVEEDMLYDRMAGVLTSIEVKADETNDLGDVTQAMLGECYCRD